jgi:tetratricopeptide (TPR) repeat protein
MSNSQAPTETPPPQPPSRLKIGIAGAAVIVFVALLLWYFAGFGTVDPAAQLELALAKLDVPDDPLAWETARRLALQAEAEDFHDPEFPGAADFVLGVVASRGDEHEADRSRRVALAIKLLRDAERQGLAEERRPEWSFALGMSLFAKGQFAQAKPLLEDAWISYPAGMLASGLALAELELADPAPGAIRFAPAILDRLDALPELTADERRQLVAARARLALRQNRLEEAEAELARLGDETRNVDVLLMKADLRLAQGRLDEARRWLLPIAFPETGDYTSKEIAAAALRLGECDERRGDAISAARAFEKAASAEPESSDGTAGALAAAKLFQQAGRDEESLSLFRQAIESQAEHDPPPVAPERFRDAIRAACELWIEREAYEAAIEVAALAEPVLGIVESLDWQARGCEKHAERVEALWQKANETRRAELARERLDRWQKSGAAYRRLAAKVNDSGRVSEALWTASDQFCRGHAFDEACEALTQLLEMRFPKIEAAAHVRRGQALLDLGRPKDAAADFQKVLDDYPTDPESFEARLLLGRCALDAGDSQRAEEAWREVLASRELTPDAVEWRAALFSLAELLYRRGVAALSKAATGASGDHPWGTDAVLPLDEAIARFDEFLRRAPDADQAIEARVLRADALRRRADLALRRAAVAETENLRQSDEQEAQRLLTESIDELRKAQAVLAPLADDDQLPPLGVQLLKSTFFDLGHSYAALRHDREAVIAFGGAVNRYPDDPRVVTAYLRMAECHKRMNRPDDARAAIEQARLALEQIPPAALAAGPSALSRDEWQSWLIRLRDRPAVAESP